jgi:phage terminase large subunit-like protein
MDEVILDMMAVYDDLDEFIINHQYTVAAFGYDPYNAASFVSRWVSEYGEYGSEVVRQGVRTESVPMGNIKVLAERRTLIFDEALMKFSMGNAVAIEDNNGNYKLSRKRSEEKIDNVAALIDAWVAYERNREAFA